MFYFFVALVFFCFFFFNDTATTEIYTLSLHDALPISAGRPGRHHARGQGRARIARPRAPASGGTFLVPRRVHGTGRDIGGCGAPRSPRGIRDPLRARPLPR